MQVRIRVSYPVWPSAPARLAETKSPPTTGGSSRVALGILASRITGLARETVFAHYFGASAVADAFRAANRIPNMLNNLFGEGVLSASFVTVYAKLRALKDDQDAEHVAAAIFGALSVVCATLVLLGVLFAPLLVDVIASGFKAETRELTIRLVRVLFPGTGMLVMSAWCLGVLNSHRRFLLSYTAPVAMNASMIAGLLAFGGNSRQPQLAVILAWAYVLGSVLQFLVQLPKVLQFFPAFRPVLDFHSQHVRRVLSNFGPIFVSRGVVQLSATVDSIIATWLPTGAVAALGYAQVISVMPISLFSMSVSAAELPALSSAVGSDQEVASFLRRRLEHGLRRIAFFIVPSAVSFLLLGDIVCAALYQSGRFQRPTAVYVWGVLAGSAVGLLASSMGRLYSSAYYALLDTRTPLKFAAIRVALTIVLGLLFALPLPHWIGIDPKWGVAGLTVSAGIAGWVEFAMLRHGLKQRIGLVGVPASFLAKLWSAAFAAGMLAYVTKAALGTAHPRLLACFALPIFGAVYAAGTLLLGVEESRNFINSLFTRLRPSMPAAR